MAFPKNRLMLPLAIYRSCTRGDIDRGRMLQALLDEVVVQLKRIAGAVGHPDRA